MNKVEEIFVFFLKKPGCENMRSVQLSIHSRVFKALNSLRQLCGKYFYEKYTNNVKYW